MDRVAILYICTGEYVVFWKDFYLSYEQKFLRRSSKEYFVFTDADTIWAEENERVHKIYQKSLGWPDNTLMRFSIFLRIKRELEKYDYIFFMNANCLCIGNVVEEEFLPMDEAILVVQHPGYYNVSNDKFAYDRNPNSMAYIKVGDGTYYVCGGVNGGKSKAFLGLMQELNDNIQVDKKNNVIAKWHDESHLNRYILENRNYRILTPSYCYPEDWDLPFEIKIMVRDKRKWIDVDKVKYCRKERIKRRVWRFLSHIKNYWLKAENH